MYDSNFLEKLEAQKEKWAKNYEELKERNIKFETDSGIPIKNIYTPLDVKSNYLEDVGFPGNSPYTRGVYPNMYRGRLWTMRLFSGHGSF